MRIRGIFYFSGSFPMNFMKKAFLIFMGFQCVMLLVMTLLSMLHGHTFLQFLSLGAIVVFGVKQLNRLSIARAAAKAAAQNANNATSPAANAAPAQSAAPAPSPAPAPAGASKPNKPVYSKKSVVVAFKPQP
jgi:predicted lipid-binding transport protein (Tim44 family)